MESSIKDPVDVATKTHCKKKSKKRKAQDSTCDVDLDKIVDRVEDNDIQDNESKVAYSSTKVDKIVKAINKKSKKKKKKSKDLTEEVTNEEDIAEPVDNIERKKKKKTKNSNNFQGIESSQDNDNSKCNTKDEKSVKTVLACEENFDGDASGDKRKKKKKKCNDKQIEDQDFLDVGEMNDTNDIVSMGKERKRKKKKYSMSENNVDPEEQDKGIIRKKDQSLNDAAQDDKKGKKNKKSKKSGQESSPDISEPVGNSERKKKKKRKNTDDFDGTLTSESYINSKCNTKDEKSVKTVLACEENFDEDASGDTRKKKKRKCNDKQIEDQDFLGVEEKGDTNGEIVSKEKERKRKKKKYSMSENELDSEEQDKGTVRKKDQSLNDAAEDDTKRKKKKKSKKDRKESSADDTVILHDKVNGSNEFDCTEEEESNNTTADYDVPAKKRNEKEEITLVLSDVVENGKLEEKIGRNKKNSNSNGNVEEELESLKNAAAKKMNSCNSVDKSDNLVVEGQWQGNLFGDTDKQNKFLRLMGGMKKEQGESVANKAKGLFSSNTGEKKKGLFGSLGSLVKPSGGNKAMSASRAASLNQSLEDEYNKALNLKLGKGRGCGIGFTPDPAEGKKFHIDASKVNSMQFDDD